MLFSFPSIATKYNGPLEAAHAHIDDDRNDMVECGAAGQPKSDISDQLRRCSFFLRMLADRAVLFGFFSVTENNGPLEAAHAHIDDDRYDMVECGAAGQPKFSQSD